MWVLGIRLEIQGGSNMTGTDFCVNKPHCAAAVRPWESEATTSTLPPAPVRTCSVHRLQQQYGEECLRLVLIHRISSILIHHEYMIYKINFIMSFTWAFVLFRSYHVFMNPCLYMKILVWRAEWNSVWKILNSLSQSYQGWSFESSGILHFLLRSLIPKASKEHIISIFKGEITLPSKRQKWRVSLFGVTTLKICFLISNPTKILNFSKYCCVSFAAVIR